MPNANGPPGAFGSGRPIRIRVRVSGGGAVCPYLLCFYPAYLQVIMLCRRIQRDGGNAAGQIEAVILPDKFHAVGVHRPGGLLCELQRGAQPGGQIIAVDALVLGMGAVKIVAGFFGKLCFHGDTAAGGDRDGGLQI